MFNLYTDMELLSCWLKTHSKGKIGLPIWLNAYGHRELQEPYISTYMLVIMVPSLNLWITRGGRQFSDHTPHSVSLVCVAAPGEEHKDQSLSPQSSLVEANTGQLLFIVGTMNSNIGPHKNINTSDPLWIPLDIFTWEYSLLLLPV